MTRAKQGLYFSWAPDYGLARKKKPSRFLGECGLIDTKEFKKSTKKDLEEEFSKTKKLDSGFKQIGYKAPSYFSYTQLATFSNCPYQYRFAHILRIPMRGKAIFSFGKTMHSTLQKLFELINEKKNLKQGDLFGETAPTPSPSPTPSSRERGAKTKTGQVNISLDEILEIYEQSWIDDWYESKKQKEEYKKNGKEILKGFYEKYKDNWPKVVMTEKGFNIKLPSNGDVYTVRGFIDRIDMVDGHRPGGARKLKIVDYKTGKPKEKLSFDEKEQLLIYQMAVKDLFKEDVGSVAFYYLNNNTEVEFLGTDEELEKVREKIINNIEEIKKGEFPPKPSQLCKFCEDRKSVV